LQKTIEISFSARKSLIVRVALPFNGPFTAFFLEDLFLVTIAMHWCHHLVSYHLVSPFYAFL